MLRRGEDKTVVERRTDTEVYRSGTRLRTKIIIFFVIFIVVGIITHFITL